MACSSEPAPASTPTTAATSLAAPSPTIVPTPPALAAPAVHGETATDTVLADPAHIVDRDRAPKPDEEAIERFVDDIRLALDEHLSSLGQGGQGTLGRLTAKDVPAPGPELTSQLATDKDWVAVADYRFLVGHEGAPVWARVLARLVRSDGSTVSPTLVFIANSKDGRPRLAAWEAPVAITDEPTPSAPAPSGATGDRA